MQTTKARVVSGGHIFFDYEYGMFSYKSNIPRTAAAVLSAEERNKIENDCYGCSGIVMANFFLYHIT